MKRSILVTGVPGVGKTTLCRKLIERGYVAYDMDEIPGLFTAIDKRTQKLFADQDNADLEKSKNLAWVCDIKKLEAVIANQPEELSFYCGNAENIDELIPLFEKVFLLTVGNDHVRNRLSTRTDNDFGRTSEVQDWLVTWKEEWEKQVIEKGAILLDGHQNPEKIIEQLLQEVNY